MANVVICGASFAGVSAAHRILKQAAKARVFVKVTLVAPNSHFYWNIAAPRAIIPGRLADDKYFQPIAAGFKQYTSDQFAFILAAVENVDFVARKIGLSGNKTVGYDYLILATGARVKGRLPFKNLDTTEATKDAMHDFQERVREARTIVIAGAGATGVEIAGELAFEYESQKEVTLIAGGPTVLEQAIPSVSDTAKKLLQDLKVKIKLETKVSKSAQTPDGRRELTLSGGEKLIADLYIPTFGMVPNSSYMSAKYLDANGFISVDQYLGVKDVENVWAIGDVSDVEPSQFMAADNQSAYMAKSIALILNKNLPSPYKLGYQGMGVQIGRKTGTGFFGIIRLPGFIVHKLRKNLFVGNLPHTVDGSAF